MDYLGINQRLRKGAFATTLTVLVLAGILMFNLLVSALSVRYGWRSDWTAGKVFSLSDTARTFLERLEEDVVIHVLKGEEEFLTGGDYYRQSAELFRQMDEASDRVQVEYIDLLRDLGFSAQYPGLLLQPGDLLLTCGEEVRLLDEGSLFYLQIDAGGAYIAASVLEQALLSSIASMTQSQAPQAVLLDGHGASSAEGLVELLELNQYEIRRTGPVVRQLPQDVSLLILSAPQSDYTETEIAEIERFLVNDGAYGKTLLYFAAADQPELPNLEAFLAEWGVGVEPGVVFETDAAMLAGDSVFLTFALYAEGDFSDQARRTGLEVFLPNARPLQALPVTGFDTPAGVDVLLSFSPSARVEGETQREDSADGIPAMLMGWRTDLEQTAVSAVLACSTSLAVEKGILAEPTCANATYFLSVLSLFTGQESGVAIEAKSLESAYLGLRYEQMIRWGTLFAAVIPAAVLAVGAYVCLRRRRL